MGRMMTGATPFLSSSLFALSLTLRWPAVKDTPPTSSHGVASYRVRRDDMVEPALLRRVRMRGPHTPERARGEGESDGKFPHSGCACAEEEAGLWGIGPGGWGVLLCVNLPLRLGS